ncbi:hypothetical protein [Mesorhizobium sp. M0323]|uniref:hypothetical protein n=1 Tax=Mesorhizobium sp. M0323 TaxID=2956938 RepID=UPI003337EE39
MDYETPEQALHKIEMLSAECAAAGIEYEEALAVINAVYGRIKKPRTVTSKDEREAQRERDVISVKRAKAMVIRRMEATILAGMTGAQIRLAKNLPDKN